MSRLNRRTKIISIRLSNEEYGQLQNLCTLKGADSISELARAAMKLLMLQENGSDKVSIESRVNEMNSRMSTLDREVARLSNLMGIARLEA
jgi:hypothetical protein